VLYLGIPQEALSVLHLDTQLFIFWEVEEPDAFFADFVVQVLVDARILDVQEADVEERVTQLLEERRLCRVIRRQRHVQYGDLLERHVCVSVGTWVLMRDGF
jgi:hypothetical protein